MGHVVSEVSEISNLISAIDSDLLFALQFENVLYCFYVPPFLLYLFY